MAFAPPTINCLRGYAAGRQSACCSFFTTFLERAERSARERTARAARVRFARVYQATLPFKPDVMWSGFQIEMHLASYDVDSKHEEMHSV